MYMSAVLRPFQSVKENNKSLPDTKIIQTQNSELVEILNDNQQKTQILNPNKEQATHQDNKKDEDKISEVLQQLLDRKIEKTLAKAEMSLQETDENLSHSTPKSVPLVDVQTSVPTSTPVTDIHLSNNIQFQNDDALNTDSQKENIKEINIVVSSKPNPGQEIKIQKQEEIVDIKNSDERTIILKEETLPVVEQQELLPVTPVAEQVPVVIPKKEKVDWFDKLFGSA